MMKNIEDLQAILTKKITGFIRVNGEEEILQPVNYIMQLGGKRMRPVLALMAANLFSDEIDDCVYPALSIEVFHNFTLMHDDIMDKAPLRRGQQTVHEKWNTNTAILSGDAMLIQAYQLLSKAPAHALKPCLDVFSKTALEVCIGQERDMQFETRTDVRLDEYIEMIRLKTSVLLGGAMQIGAIIQRASEDDKKNIYAFGENLGIAFQLWDDYLDAFGDSVKVGKQRGGDILADKKTYLLIKALELADNNQKKDLHRFIGNTSISADQKVDGVLNIFEQLDIRSLLRAEMDMHYSKAIDALNNVSVPQDRKKLLITFAESIMVREK